MWTKAFWLAACERALATLGQVVLAGVGNEAVGLFEVDWKAVLGIAATATLLSFVKSIVASGIGRAGPSLGGGEVLAGEVLSRRSRRSRRLRRSHREGLPPGVQVDDPEDDDAGDEPGADGTRPDSDTDIGDDPGPGGELEDDPGAGDALADDIGPGGALADDEALDDGHTDDTAADESVGEAPAGASAAPASFADTYPPQLTPTSAPTQSSSWAPGANTSA